MNMKDEALRLALEALKSIFASTHPYREDGTCTINDDSVELSNKAIAAIEEALEAKEKPAVNNKDTALRLAIESLCCVRDMVGHPDNLEYIDHQIAKIEAALEAKDEPAAWMYPDDLKRFETSEAYAEAYSIEMVSPTKGETVPLYTTPPQRTWVGLTDEEIDVIYEKHHNQYGECESVNWGYERAIEVKLKEKNT